MSAVNLCFYATEAEIKELLPKLHEKEIYPNVEPITDSEGNDTGKRLVDYDVFYFSYSEVEEVVAQFRELDIDPYESDYPEDYF